MAESPSGSEAVDTGKYVRGNIDLEPVPRVTLSIASGVLMVEDDTYMDEGDRLTTSANQPTDVSSIAASNDLGSKYWVQVGALSNQVAAQKFWSSLKRRHATVLDRWKPQIFSPSEVGGGLYHIRLGPMIAEAAAGLCDELLAIGADCFSLGADDSRLEATNSRERDSDPS